MLRFKNKAKILDVGITVAAGFLSVGVMLYAVAHFGLREAWNELILNLFYVACLVMMLMFFFNRLDSQRFNYWCSLCLGVTIVLRDILFPPPMASYPIHVVSLALSVLLLLMLTFYYARKDWKSYTKANLWMIFIVDMLIGGLYNYALYLDPIDEYTDYLLTEYWIRPTISYGLVACFITEKNT